MDGTKSSSFSYFWRTSSYQGDEKLCEVKEKSPIATKNLTELFKIENGSVDLVYESILTINEFFKF